MRFFPSAPCSSDPTQRTLHDVVRRCLQPQWLVTLVAIGVTTGGVVVPLAQANDEDDLRDKQHQVEGQIDRAQEELQEASRDVSRATGRLDDVRTQLSSARARLTRVKTRLHDARVEAHRLELALEKAEARLDRAALELRAARAEVARQREQLRGTVIGMATQGDPRLEMLSSYLSSGSIEETLVNETASEMVVGREDQALTGLEHAEAALEDHKAEVRDARDDVAAQEDAAQANLEQIKTFLGQVKATKARVDRLVVQARDARQDALKARKRDRAALRRLEEREERIKQEILELAQQTPGRNYQGNADGLLQTPVAGPVTSPFGYRRHPIYGYWGLHDGTDFGAGCGSQLWAGESGTVINAYFDEVYGNRLYLSIGRVNGANITLVYNHMSGYNVSEGSRVGRGDVVGWVGTTGWSTGCHLHFTVLRNGEPVDPMNYL